MAIALEFIQSFMVNFKPGDVVKIVGSDKMMSFRHLQYLNHRGVVSYVAANKALVIPENAIRPCDKDGLYFYFSEIEIEKGCDRPKMIG